MAATEPARRRAGGWTYEDLLRLRGEGGRYEVIDGELYELPGANWDHATAVISLIAILLPAARSVNALIRTAPLDVFIPGTDPVQPDVLVLMPDQLDLVSRRGVEGAPALVIEVLSPSNPEHDRVRKRAVYARGGVREYWLVDPGARTIEVLVLDGGEYGTHARAGGDDLVTSTVLPGLSFPASEAFL